MRYPNEMLMILRSFILIHVSRTPSYWFYPNEMLMILRSLIHVSRYCMKSCNIHEASFICLIAFGLEKTISKVVVPKAITKTTCQCLATLGIFVAQCKPFATFISTMIATTISFSCLRQCAYPITALSDAYPSSRMTCSGPSQASNFLQVLFGNQHVINIQ